MKFGCERCKTRYNIADDRVRGKVLKIRCKNCEYVITVREGMDLPDDGGRSPATTIPPGNIAAAAAPSPPPAATTSSAENASNTSSTMEAEWYLSRDGKQEGPFTIKEAQGWIRQQPASADLHCWSDGFDEWQSVENVGQLRGLRQAAKPAPPPKPPSPAPFAVASQAQSEPVSAADPFAALAQSAQSTQTSKTSDPFAARAAQLAPSLPSVDEDDLSIGEVSRVVNLADLARSKPKADASKGRTPAPSVGAVANGTGPILRAPDAVTAGLALAAQESQADAAADVAPHGEAPQLAAPAAPSHKRGWLLLVGAAVVVGGVVAAFVLTQGGSDEQRIISDNDVSYDDLGKRGPGVIIIGQGSNSVGSNNTGSGSGSSSSVPKVFIPRDRPNTNPGSNTGGTKVDPGDRPQELSADDFDAMFSRNSTMSQRCYEQALRRDPFLDVKKLSVTISVDKAGTVSNVALSSHQDHQLGICLSNRIKGWKFKETVTGGATRINLVFGK